MTHRYDHHNHDKKRGPKWLLLHCAFCGDLLPRYCIELVTQRGKVPEVCDCSEGLQRSRRHVREDHAKKIAEEIERERRRAQARPNYADPVTKLGA